MDKFKRLLNIIDELRGEMDINYILFFIKKIYKNDNIESNLFDNRLTLSIFSNIS